MGAVDDRCRRMLMETDKRMIEMGLRFDVTAEELLDRIEHLERRVAYLEREKRKLHDDDDTIASDPAT